MPTRARKAKADAVAVGTSIPKPRGKAPEDFPHWDETLGAWKNDAGEVRPAKEQLEKDRCVGGELCAFGAILRL